MQSRTNRNLLQARSAIILTSALLAASALSAQETQPKVTPGPTAAEAAAVTERAPSPPTGSRVFVSQETGMLTNEPAPGQLERLLALERQLVQQRADSSVQGTQTSVEDLVNHTSEIFATPVGVGAKLDDRFLHSLRVKVSAEGQLVYFCTSEQHDHSASAVGGSALVPQPLVQE